jgi:ribosomal protein S18 acetylase RimI-like enzyme
MKITPVTTPSGLETFIRLPYKLYKKDPDWVPPLRKEVSGQFDRSRNPTLEHCEYALFLLERNDEIIGRIAAFTDTVALDEWREPVGLFGYFECIDDEEAANKLLDAAAEWLKGKGMKYIRGPWSFVSQEWGLVIEGFTPPPTVMAPYNPPFYIDHLRRYGFEKVKDLLVYYISAAEGYKIPDRILTLTDDVAKRFNVRTRQLNMRDYDNEVTRVIELSNKSLADNWGYTQVTRKEADAIAADLKPILHPEGVIFAEDSSGRPVGFAIAIPDVNSLLKGLGGRLLPFGWLKLLLGIPRLHRYRLFALGVLPEYQGKGIDSLIYRALYESLFTRDLFLEINYVLEDNAPMNNAIIKLAAKPLRLYRIYQKSIE